jgi:hypothetical protein
MMVVVIFRMIRRIPVAVRAVRVGAGFDIAMLVRHATGFDMLFAGFHHDPRCWHDATEQAQEKACEEAADDQRGHMALQERISLAVKRTVRTC